MPPLIYYQPIPHETSPSACKKARVHNRNRCLCRIVGLASAIFFLLAGSAPAAQVIQTLPFYDSFDYNPGASGLASASSTVWETCFSTGNIQVTGNSLTLAGFISSAGNSVIGAT